MRLCLYQIWCYSCQNYRNEKFTKKKKNNILLISLHQDEIYIHICIFTAHRIKIYFFLNVRISVLFPPNYPELRMSSANAHRIEMNYDFDPWDKNYDYLILPKIVFMTERSSTDPLLGYSIHSGNRMLINSNLKIKH